VIQADAREKKSLFEHVIYDVLKTWTSQCEKSLILQVLTIEY
jgi:hypothetical protein